MASVEQPVESFTLPEQSHIDPRVESSGEANQRVNGNAVGVTTLDAADDRTRHAGFRTELRLGQAAALTKRAVTQTEAEAVHTASIATRPLRALTRKSPSR